MRSSTPRRRSIFPERSLPKRGGKRPARLPGLLAATLLVAAAVAGQTAEERAPEATAADRDRSGEVIVLTLDSIIHPVAEEVLVDALDEADRVDAELLVVELNTPGGLLNSTRRMYSAMLEAATPVAVWVAPRGAQAASAGFFLLMAADIAAMAPGSNTGAAHPVAGQGQDIEGAMGEKVEQDAAASIRSLAERRGRDAKLAEAAVLESRSFSATEALEAGLVDLVAADLDELLRELSGREIEKQGRTVTLRTAEAQVRRLDLTPFQQVRSVLADPNIAYMLLSLGGLGLYFELANPGAIFPGVIGAVCLLLALYSLSVLPVSWAGLGLMLLAGILFILEIKVQSFGLLTVGGVGCLVLGSVMLFQSPDPALEVSYQLIALAAGLTLVVVAVLARLAYRAQHRHVHTGNEGLVDETGEARSELDPSGKVMVHGELWHAVAETPVAAGQRIVVTGVDGLTLRVKAVE